MSLEFQDGSGSAASVPEGSKAGSSLNASFSVIYLNADGVFGLDGAVWLRLTSLGKPGAAHGAQPR
jgi:hypothetical protein